MDRTQHVLDAIDGALEDWTVSGDAMRWTPEPERHATSRLIGGPAVLHIGPPDSPVQRLLERSMWAPQRPVDAEETRRILERIGQGMQPVMEAAHRMAEGLGASVDEILGRLAGMRPLADARPEPEDPRERALRLRQRRYTGPSRDVTRQRRPRLHVG